jgi:hypothetical protein
LASALASALLSQQLPVEQHASLLPPSVIIIPYEAVACEFREKYFFKPIQYFSMFV